MSLPLHPNKFRTVDTICKLGSYPVPKEGHFIAMMDKITTQELGGVIVFETANPPNHPHNKCLGYLLDQIFSDFANINIPSIDILVAGKHIPNNPKPKTAQTRPSSPAPQKPHSTTHPLSSGTGQSTSRVNRKSLTSQCSSIPLRMPSGWPSWLRHRIPV